MIKSYCKINVSLRVIKKLKNNFHKINTIFTFANIFDQIYIKEAKLTKDKILFYGPFKNKIKKKNNTVFNTLNLLRKNGFIKNIFFKVKIKKNIPPMSGLGGGSMNSASIFVFLIKKYKLKIKLKDLFKFTNKIGSDVFLGLKNTTSYFESGNNEVKRYKKKLNLYVLLVKPNVNCSTKLIYKKTKSFSKQYKDKSFIKLTKHLKNDVNDLEDAAFKIYPEIKRLKDHLNMQKNCQFSRMTGSGSVCVGYFKDYKFARKAEVNVNNKFPKYWCKLSKAM